MLSFYHAGDMGDVIYGMYVINRLGGGELYVGERTDLGEFQPRTGITIALYNFMITLFKSQTYIKNSVWVNHVPFVDYDLNRFRLYWAGQIPFEKPINQRHLLEMHCKAQKIEFFDEVWLKVPDRKKYQVIIARSKRQRNPRFPWMEVLHKYPGRVGFVGLQDEYEEFVRTYGFVEHVPIPTALCLAEVIQGADLFVGNSSFPLALAVAMGKRCVQEVSTETLENAHTRSIFACQTDWFPGYRWPDI